MQYYLVLLLAFSVTWIASGKEIDKKGSVKEKVVYLMDPNNPEKPTEVVFGTDTSSIDGAYLSDPTFDPQEMDDRRLKDSQTRNETPVIKRQYKPSTIALSKLNITGRAVFPSLRFDLPPLHVSRTIGDGRQSQRFGSSPRLPID